MSHGRPSARRPAPCPSGPGPAAGKGRGTPPKRRWTSCRSSPTTESRASARRGPRAFAAAARRCQRGIATAGGAGCTASPGKPRGRGQEHGDADPLVPAVEPQRERRKRRLIIETPSARLHSDEQRREPVQGDRGPRVAGCRAMGAGAGRLAALRRVGRHVAAIIAHPSVMNMLLRRPVPPWRAIGASAVACMLRSRRSPSRRCPPPADRGRRSEAPEDRPRALRRRRPRHHAHRRARGPGRNAHSGRLHRGDVDGLDRRRPLRERALAGGNGHDRHDARLDDAVLGFAAAARARFPRQADRHALSAAARNRIPRRPDSRLPGRAERGESRTLPARAHGQRRRHPRSRPAADSVSRGRDRHGGRRPVRLHRGAAVRGDARQHVDPGRLFAGRDARPDPGRRRPRRQPAGRRRARDGRRSRHRRQHRHAARDARGAVVDHRPHRPDDQHPDRAERPPPARVAARRRRADLAQPRRAHGVRFRQQPRNSSSYGVAAAREAAPKLAALALSPEAYAAYKAARPRIADTPPPKIEFVRVEGTDYANPKVLALDLDVPLGEPLDTKELDDAISRLYGTSEYERIDYHVVEDDGRTGLAGQRARKADRAATTCASASTTRPTSRARARSRCWRATAASGSTASARNG